MHKQSRDGALYAFWINMPIRRITLQAYRDEILKLKENYITKELYETTLYKLNKYVIYGDERNQTAGKRLFEEARIKHGSDWVLFALAFLTVQDINGEMNKKYLYDISNHLKIKAIDNLYFMSEENAKRLYHVYVHIISDGSVDPVFDSMFENNQENKDYKSWCHHFYREDLRILVIDYIFYNKGYVKGKKVALSDLLNQIDNLQDDNNIRKQLEDANTNEGKYIIIKPKLKELPSMPSIFEQPKIEEKPKVVIPQQDFDDDSIANPEMFGQLL